MTPIDVVSVGAGVGAVDEEAAVWAERYVLDHEGAGRQELRRRALVGMMDRIEMRPAVLIREEDEMIVGGPVQVGAAGGARQ